MKKIALYLKARLSHDDGATAIEYGLIAALIAVVIIVGVNFIGGQLNSTFSRVGSTISSAAS